MSQPAESEMSRDRLLQLSSQLDRLLAEANSILAGPVYADIGVLAEEARELVVDMQAKAGLQVGDVVIAFNGQAIRDFPELAKTVRLYQPGDTIPVSINRAGSIMEVNVVLQRRGGQ